MSQPVLKQIQRTLQQVESHFRPRREQHRLEVKVLRVDLSLDAENYGLILGLCERRGLIGIEIDRSDYTLCVKGLTPFGKMVLEAPNAWFDDSDGSLEDQLDALIERVQRTCACHLQRQQAMTSLSQRFNTRMRGAYTTAKSLGYDPKGFASMIAEHGFVGATRILLRPGPAQSGFDTLWSMKRLDLSVESIVANEDWGDLFTAAEVEEARRRLDELEGQK